ncbi:potassium channel subfamily t member 2 [Plakobranchus ocellatus]|uniref:Potassium channel subfamily t member 2 n=1 Tax=Plakobranchus ocellatus TaxID=259542 RepID=A0AAV4A5D2_9GAST|nr:potassium channel subfamily t member 2 [Plakobranchus ocellatus]
MLKKIWPKQARNEGDVIQKTEKTLSYVIVNPLPTRNLKTGDIVYVIQPSAMQAVPNKLNRSNRGITAKYLLKRNMSSPGNNEAVVGSNGNSKYYREFSSPQSRSGSRHVSGSDTSGDHSSSTLPHSSGSPRKRQGTVNHPGKGPDVQRAGTESEGEGEDVNELDDIVEVRPRCQSESCCDRKSGCIKIKPLMRKPNGKL